jgi:hypothetical protein
MLAHSLLVLAALTATAAPVPPEDASGLRWKFEKGQTFYQVQTTRSSQTVTVAGSDLKQTQSLTYVMSWTPEKQDGDRWILKQRIEAVKMEIDMGGNTIAYDSTKPKAAKGALDDFFAALIGCELHVTLDRTYQVQKVEGAEKLVKKLTGDRPEMQALLQGLLSEDALKEMANPMPISAPKGRVEKGDYWVREKVTDLGAVGRWVGRWQCSHAGKEGRNIKLKVDAVKVEFQPPKADAATPLPFKITASDFKSKNIAGWLLFDPAKGRMHSAEMSMDLEGELTIEIGGQAQTMHMMQSEKTTWTVSDSNPLKK